MVCILRFNKKHFKFLIKLNYVFYIIFIVIIIIKINYLIKIFESLIINKIYLILL